MCPPMNGQGTALDERFLAGFVVTCIRSFVGMDTVMPLEIRLAIEALLPFMPVSALHCSRAFWKGRDREDESLGKTGC